MPDFFIMMRSLIVLGILLIMSAIFVKVLIIRIFNFFANVRRRRKARMEDGVVLFDDWKNGHPNQEVPGHAKPVNFDPNEF